jgi:hypothetical protein
MMPIPPVLTAEFITACHFHFTTELSREQYYIISARPNITSYYLTWTIMPLPARFKHHLFRHYHYSVFHRAAAENSRLLPGRFRRLNASGKPTCALISRT